MSIVDTTSPEMRTKSVRMSCFASSSLIASPALTLVVDTIGVTVSDDSDDAKCVCLEEH